MTEKLETRGGGRQTGRRMTVIYSDISLETRRGRQRTRLALTQTLRRWRTMTVMRMTQTWRLPE